MMAMILTPALAASTRGCQADPGATYKGTKILTGSELAGVTPHKLVEEPEEEEEPEELEEGLVVGAGVEALWYDVAAWVGACVGAGVEDPPPWWDELCVGAGVLW